MSREALVLAHNSHLSGPNLYRFKCMKCGHVDVVAAHSLEEAYGIVVAHFLSTHGSMPRPTQFILGRCTRDQARLYLAVKQNPVLQRLYRREQKRLKYLLKWSRKGYLNPPA